MADSGIAPGCSRLTIDLPTPLRELLDADAARPPAIPTQEYVRRLVAHHFSYDMPSYTERRAQRLTLSGRPRNKPGPKPRAPEAPAE